MFNEKSMFLAWMCKDVQMNVHFSEVCNYAKSNPVNVSRSQLNVPLRGFDEHHLNIWPKNALLLNQLRTSRGITFKRHFINF